MSRARATSPLLARVAMRVPLVRSIVREHSDVIEDGSFTVHTWNDLLGVFPGLIGVKTGHTDKAGWCEVAAARRQGYTIYVVILGSPTRAQRNTDLDRLLSWGVSQYRTLTLVAAKPYAAAALPYGLPAVPLRASKPLVRVVRTGRPLVQRVIAPSATGAAGAAGAAAGPDRDLGRRQAARGPAAAGGALRRAARPRRQATLVRDPDSS